jgi:hypothetical protein
LYNSEILEEDLYAKVEKKHWAEEQEKLRKEKGKDYVVICLSFLILGC